MGMLRKLKWMMWLLNAM
jgi:hypothetical protein